MRPATPRSYYLAQQVLAGEAGEGDQAELLDGADRAIEKARRQLSRWVGAEGFDALFAHALHLSRADFPCLPSVVQAQEPGRDRLADWRSGLLQQDPLRAREALTRLLANLIWLLGLFMGEEIVLRQLQKVWPELTVDGTSTESQEAQP